MILSTACLMFALASGDMNVLEPPKSGPQVGARNNRRGFFPLHVTGPGAGQRICPV